MVRVPFSYSKGLVMISSDGGRTLTYAESIDPNRYKEKIDRTLSESEFLKYLENARRLDQEREYNRLHPAHFSHARIKNVKTSALLARLYYLGSRISEITGDTPHRYSTKDGIRYTAKIHGLRRQDIQATDSALRVDPKEVRKHGMRYEPLYLPLELPRCHRQPSAMGDHGRP